MIVYFYLAYLAISILITLWVGRSLHKNGRVFLVENFKGNETLADSVNHLLLVGFYLINIGFVCLNLRYGTKPVNVEQGIEFLTMKEGRILMILGGMHFFNMYILTKFRHFDPFGQQEKQQPAGTAQADIKA